MIEHTPQSSAIAASLTEVGSASMSAQHRVPVAYVVGAADGLATYVGFTNDSESAIARDYVARVLEG